VRPNAENELEEWIEELKKIKKLINPTDTSALKGKEKNIQEKLLLKFNPKYDDWGITADELSEQSKLLKQLNKQSEKEQRQNQSEAETNDLPVQTKSLEVTQAGDRYEQEADEIALCGAISVAD
jgi:hypothetical protein